MHLKIIYLHKAYRCFFTLIEIEVWNHKQREIWNFYVEQLFLGLMASLISSPLVKCLLKLKQRELYQLDS